MKENGIEVWIDKNIYWRFKIIKNIYTNKTTHNLKSFKLINGEKKSNYYFQVGFLESTIDSVNICFPL